MKSTLKFDIVAENITKGFCIMKIHVRCFKVGSKSIRSVMLNIAKLSVICQNGVPFILLNECLYFPEE